MLPTTLAELDRIREECRAMVTTRAALSAGVAAIPLPGVDLGADVGLLMELIPAINRKFGLSPVQIADLDSNVRDLVFVTVTAMGTRLVGKAVTRELLLRLLATLGMRTTVGQVAKYVPFLGAALSAGISFGAMKLVGNAHIEECCGVVRKTIEHFDNNPAERVARP